MTVEQALAEAVERLAQAGIEQPRREARLLLAQAGGALPDAPGARLPPEFWELLQRRCGREPMALITGRQGFWTLDLAVSDQTLIPRADSETLIEAALSVFPDRRQVRRVLDLGTGTGALLLAALSEFAQADGIGIDITPAACALARGNAAAHGMAARAHMAAGDWAACVAGRFDLVLANPPYVETATLATLMPEVARFEPRRALDGGPDGLDAFRRILADLARLLQPAGRAIFEVGAGQARAVVDLAEQRGLALACTYNDLAGVARAVVLKKAVGSVAAPD